MLGIYKRKLEELGVASAVVKEAAETTLAEVHGIGPQRDADIAAGQTIIACPTPSPPAKKVRRTKDRGTLTMEDPPCDMRFGDPRVRLDWIVRHANYPNPNLYVERCRTRINRNKKIATCFHTCCRSNADIFIQKHQQITAKGKVQHFRYRDFKCADCDSRK